MPVYRPSERRLVLRLMAYWDDMRGDSLLPVAADIDPEVLGDDWAHCYLLEARYPAIHSEFKHIGSIFDPEMPEGGIDTMLECPHGTLLHAATHYLDRVLQKKVPISLGGAASLGPDEVIYRSVLLPFSSDGETIDHVLGGANYKVTIDDEDDNIGPEDE